METFNHVEQPDLDVLKKGYPLKGKWKSNFFKNFNPLVLELGCGMGEYTVGLAKSKGSSNPHNLVKATLMALLELRDPRAIAMQRGITMDKVFNG